MPGDPFDTPHVLIVEDDPEIAAMVAEGLKKPIDHGALGFSAE